MINGFPAAVTTVVFKVSFSTAVSVLTVYDIGWKVAYRLAYAHYIANIFSFTRSYKAYKFKGYSILSLVHTED